VHDQGALVPNKCFWYLIDQVWSDGKWCYQPIDHTHMTLQVGNSQGQIHTILHLEVTDAHQTLGVCIVPNGNSLAKYQYLKSIATKWKNKMEQAHLTHNDAFFSL